MCQQLDATFAFSRKSNKIIKYRKAKKKQVKCLEVLIFYISLYRKTKEGR